MSKGSLRYLYLIPQRNQRLADETVTLAGVGTKPQSVVLLSDGQPLPFTHDSGVVAVSVPANRRSGLVDVVGISR